MGALGGVTPSLEFFETAPATSDRTGLLLARKTTLGNTGEMSLDQ